METSAYYGGSFRRSKRLLCINRLEVVTVAVVEAARDNLVIGTS